MKYDRDQQLQLNQKHKLEPQRGDYWNEMCCPVCVVIQCIGNNVVFCKTKKDCGNNMWQWDMDCLEIKPISQFAEWLSYDSMPDKTWCDVIPQHHLTYIEELEQDNEHC